MPDLTIRLSDQDWKLIVYAANQGAKTVANDYIEQRGHTFQCLTETVEAVLKLQKAVNEARIFEPRDPLPEAPNDGYHDEFHCGQCDFVGHSLQDVGKHLMEAHGVSLDTLQNARLAEKPVGTEGSEKKKNY